MSASPLRPLLIATALAAGAAAGAACLDPVETARPSDAGSAGGDAGTAADAACPDCLPKCAPSCASDAGCPWARSPAFSAGCPPTSVSLTLEGGDAGLPVAAFCACGDAWLATSGGDGGWRTGSALATSCARTSLRLGPGGRPSLLVTSSSGTVRLVDVHSNGSVTVEEPPQLHPPATFAIDGAGVYHLAGLGQSAILYLRRTAGKWTLETAAPGYLASGSDVLLALGPDGEPRIAFSQGGVELAERAPDAGWSRSVVAPEGLPTSLQVDGAGRAQLLYLSEGLHYAAQTPAGFATELIDGKAIDGQLRLGAGGCPRAIWSAMGLWYGERTPAGWKAERIADGAFTVADEPFALRRTGQPLVLSFDGQPYLTTRR